MPSSFSDCCRPWLARLLNDRSFRPPMSVTRPTLIFLPEGADDEEDDVDEPPDDEDLLSLLEPHAAAKSRRAAMAIATISRREERADTSVTPSQRWFGIGTVVRTPGRGASLSRRPAVPQRSEHVIGR